MELLCKSKSGSMYHKVLALSFKIDRVAIIADNKDTKSDDCIDFLPLSKVDFIDANDRNIDISTRKLIVGKDTLFQISIKSIIFKTVDSVKSDDGCIELDICDFNENNDGYVELDIYDFKTKLHKKEIVNLHKINIWYNEDNTAIVFEPNIAYISIKDRLLLESKICSY